MLAQLSPMTIRAMKLRGGMSSAHFMLVSFLLAAHKADSSKYKASKELVLHK